MAPPSNEEELCKRAIDMKIVCLSSLTNTLIARNNLRSSVVLSIAIVFLTILSISLVMQRDIFNALNFSPVISIISIGATIITLYITALKWGPDIIKILTKRDLEEIGARLKKLEVYCGVIDKELNDCWEKYCPNISNNVCRELKTLISP